MQTDVTFESREHLSFDVAGMHCAGCANRLKRLLGEQAGVSDAEVNFAAERASIAFEPSQFKAVEVADALRVGGFRPALKTQSFHVEGMHCSNCSTLLRGACKPTGWCCQGFGKPGFGDVVCRGLPKRRQLARCSSSCP